MEYLYIIGLGLLLAIVIAWHVEAMVWVAFALAMIIEPVVSMLLPEIRQLHWIVTIFYVWVWFVLIARLVMGKVEPTPQKIPSPFIFFFVFLFCGALGSAYALNFSEAISAGKGYFQAWVIPFVFYFLIKHDRTVASFAFGLLLLASIQPFVVAVQIYVMRDLPYFGDRLGGTFGDSLGSGAILSMFQLTQAIVILSLFRFGIIKAKWALLLTAWICSPLLWTHAKAVVVLLPIGLGVLFWRDLKARPMFGAGMMLAGIAFTGIIAFQYYQDMATYKPDASGVPATFEDFIHDSLSYSVMDKGREGLNRGTSLVYWVETHGLFRNPLETLLGHGLGSAKDTGKVVGHLYDDPDYGRPGMGITTISRLLWEVGLIGALSFVAAFFALARYAGRLSVDGRVPVVHRAISAANGALAVVFIVAMFWRKDFVVSVTFGTFAMFSLAYVMYWLRVIGNEDDVLAIGRRLGPFHGPTDSV